MSKEELGTLIVVILKGRNLIDKHSFYKQDVYCQAVLNGTTQKSEVDAKGGQHPVWDSELRFPIMKDSADKYRKLEISCWSKEPRTDEILGTGKIDINETLKTGEFDDWVLLDIDGVQRGEVYLEMTYFSNAPPPAPKAPKQHQQQPMLAPPVMQPGKPLQRRPSKWAPAERLARPASYYQVPSQLKPAGRPDVSPTRTGQHLNPHPNPHSPPSSRSSSHSPTHKHDALPPLPNEAPARVPTILRPGPKAGNPPSRQISSEIPSSHRNSYPNPYDDPPLPARNDQAPPPSHTPNPLWADHHEYNPSAAPPMFPLPNVTVEPAPAQGHTPAPPSASTPSSYTYYQPPSHADYAPPQHQSTYPPPGAAPQHQQTYPPLPVPPRQQQTYPQPPPAQYPSTQTPHHANQYPPQTYYGQPTYSPAPYSHPQYHQSPPPPERSNLPDPYLLARYQTPLPLPPGAVDPSPPSSNAPAPYRQPSPPRRQPSPPRQLSPPRRQPSPPRRQPSPPRKQPAPLKEDQRVLELRAAEAAAARRKEQEERDMELARKLDMELNLSPIDSGKGRAPSDGSSSGIPGGWR